MRLSDFEQIAYGKEEDDKDELSRKDIIYRIFLGDRQVWERTTDFNPSKTLSNKIITTWNIKTDFVLANVTDVSVITGLIEWSDEDTENWRSGESGYYHKFIPEGEYNITLNCQSFKSDAAIGQIKEVNHYGSSNNRNELIGVTFGKVPFADWRLGTREMPEGVFENITTIKEITIPNGVERIPPRIFYNTSFTELIVPESVNRIEDYAFVSSKDISVYIMGKESPDSCFGTKCINSSGIVKFYCDESNTSAIAYANSIGAIINPDD